MMTTLLNIFPAVLAYRPFLDPLDLHDHWLWLLPPLAFVIALVYKTLKLPHLDHLWPQTFRLTGVILLVAALAAGALWATVELVA
ncbi:MAG: hypothetical protein WD294_13020 [Phycisphaeraceae bacterium]